MFSVIIPLYNKSLYVEKCLHSVLLQTFRLFEIIVVNDGSTDDGPEKVRNIISNQTIQRVPEINYPLPTIQMIEQSNFGVSIARNNGVKAAKYDYIAFLDGDDWWEPGYLEEMKDLVRNFPQANLFGCNYYYIKYGRVRKSMVGVEPSFEKGIINFFQVYAKTLCIPIISSSVVIRKAIFESENGFKSGLKLGEDFDLWVRVALKYPVAYLNKPLANYNQDVELKGRAIGNLHKSEAHILWNLEYLAGEERTNTNLKQLLDNLRVYSLMPYFLNNKYRELARQELNKVNWIKQPASAKRRYNSPIFIMKFFSHIQYVGSKIKQLVKKSK